jgi:hypothetical protein
MSTQPSTVAAGSPQALLPGFHLVADLVGRDVDGLLADVRSFEGGELRYAHCDKPNVARLKRVYRKPRTSKELTRGIGSEDWLTVEWHDGMYHICGCTHSGCCDAESNATWQIKLLD